MSSTALLRSCSVDITPTKPIQLAGYDNRPLPFDSVADKLEAGIIYITDADKTLVFISLDTFFVTHELKLSILEKFNSVAKNKLQEKDVFFTASHTHFSPSLDPLKPVLGRSDEHYITEVRDKIVHALTELEGTNAEPIQITIHNSESNHTINRRRQVITRERFQLKKKIQLAPNPLGKTSSTISLIRFTDAKNKTCAILWHFACHPTNFYRHNAVSADFIGVVREKLREQEGNIPVLFLQGFAGDIKPWLFDHDKKIKKNISSLLRLTETFPLFDENVYKKWSARLSEDVAETLKSQGKKIAPQLDGKLLVRPISTVFTNEKRPADSISLQEIKLGKELTFVSISAEAVFEYEAMVQAIYKGDTVLCCGYTDSVHIYLPTQEQVKEGGYEAQGFMEKFGYNGNFVRDLDQKVEAAFRELRNKE